MKNLTLIFILLASSFNLLIAQVEEQVPIMESINGEMVGDFMEFEEEIKKYKLTDINDGFSTYKCLNKKNNTQCTLEAIKKTIRNKFDKNIVKKYKKENVEFLISIMVDESGMVSNNGGKLTINKELEVLEVYSEFSKETARILKGFPKIIPGKLKDKNVIVETKILIKF